MFPKTCAIHNPPYLLLVRFGTGFVQFSGFLHVCCVIRSWQCGTEHFLCLHNLLWIILPSHETLPIHHVLMAVWASFSRTLGFKYHITLYFSGWWLLLNSTVSVSSIYFMTYFEHVKNNIALCAHTILSPLMFSRATLMISNF